MPISPILASLILAPLLQRDNTYLLLYADDGMLFSNENHILPPIFPSETGISFQPKKSHHVKENNIWLRPLDFLGIRYTPNYTSSDDRISSGILENRTRTHKPFKLDKLDLFARAGYGDKSTHAHGSVAHASTTMNEALTAWLPQTSYGKVPHSNFDQWLQTKIAGYLHSRLYLGTFSSEEILQDFTLSYVERSWTYLEKERMQHNSQYILNGAPFPERFTIFNTSSLANQSLSRWMKHCCPTLKSGNSLSRQCHPSPAAGSQR